jgi:hypothetical protein
MERYGIRESDVLLAVRNSDSMSLGYEGRSIAQKAMDDLLLRVVFEQNEFITVVTVYPARRKRYAPEP